MPRHHAKHQREASGRQHLLSLVVGLLLTATLGSAVATVLTSPTAAAAARYVAPVASGRAAACHRPAPTTAAGYQAMFDAKNDSTWAGGDQAATVALPDGRTLWLFGDTVQGRRLPGGARSTDSRFVHNSLLVQDKGCLTAVPAGAEVIPSRGDGQWYWPQSAVVTGRRLVVLCARVERTGPGAFDFRTTGVDAAVFSLSSGTPRFERVVDTPSSVAAEGADQYGKAVLRQGDWLYLYGTRQEQGAFGRSVRVARVRATDLLEASAWTYWTGRGWSARPSLAAEVAHGWSTAFSVWADASGAVRMMTKAQDVYGHEVVSGRAPSPVGPFAARAVLTARSGSVLLYNALAHPELRLAGGGVLVSVCRNSADLDVVFADTDLYKPQFASVTP
jgi:hypothetical protein